MPDLTPSLEAAAAFTAKTGVVVDHGFDYSKGATPPFLRWSDSKVVHPTEATDRDVQVFFAAAVVALLAYDHDSTTEFNITRDGLVLVTGTNFHGTGPTPLAAVTDALRKIGEQG